MTDVGESLRLFGVFEVINQEKLSERKRGVASFPSLNNNNIQHFQSERSKLPRLVSP
jgi:hypothetical protein